MSIPVEMDVWKSDAANEQQIDRVLAHYHSPFVGRGSLIFHIASQEGLNPIFILAVMQQTSSFGNRANQPSLKSENIANPMAVHFNEGAKGILKLRLRGGNMPTFEQSLIAFAHDFKARAAGSATPITAYACSQGSPPTWSAQVLRAMLNISRYAH